MVTTYFGAKPLYLNNLGRCLGYYKIDTCNTCRSYFSVSWCNWNMWSISIKCLLGKLKSELKSPKAIHFKPVLLLLLLLLLLSWLLFILLLLFLTMCMYVSETFHLFVQLFSFCLICTTTLLPTYRFRVHRMETVGG